MMTNKDQVVTGNLKFGHVAMTELMVSKGHRINGIDPSKIVTTDTPQSIGGQKTFSKLNVPGDLGVVTTTNGVRVIHSSPYIAYCVVELEQVAK